MSFGQFAPFGQELDNETTANRYKYTGLELDGESQLDHATFRQYSPISTRWMTADPFDGSIDASNPQSLNRYSYVGNMPLAFTDPSGLSPETGGARLLVGWEVQRVVLGRSRVMELSGKRILVA